MATTTTKKVTRKKTTVPKEPTVAAEISQEEEVEVVATPKKTATKKAKIVYKEVPFSDNDLVTVRNGFHGELVYKNRSGEVWIWNEFGDEQDLEVGELRAARNTSKSFYQNNWFMIDDPAVLKYLNVEEFYKNSLTIDEFNTLFNRPNDEIIEKVSKLPQGQKASLGYIVKRLVRDGEIDSLKLIGELEKILGITLREIDALEVPELKVMEG